MITDFAKDTFIVILREYFTNHDIWTYHEDKNQTKIQICDENALNLEVSEFRPSIVTSRTPIRWAKICIGQNLDYDFKTGKRSYTDLFNCGTILKCISREGVEADKIASEVFNFIHMSRDSIRVSFQIFSLEGLELGVETPYKKDSKYDLVMVPVTIRLLKQVNWSSTPIAPVLRDINIKIK